MGKLFDNMLKSDETLFKNEVALDFSFQPKIVPYREAEQRHIANCIKPLFSSRTGKNVFIFGNPGVGKTAACKHILTEIQEETDDVLPVYINCWQKNTSYKIILELCNILDYKFTQNRRTEELFNVAKQLLNRKSVVFVFDEFDKMEEHDFLYITAEEIFRKSIILITNLKEFLSNLDDRIKSRLMADSLEFKPYNYDETKGILKQRMDYAFWPGVWEEGALEIIAAKTAEKGDIREGLNLMRESANIAEGKSSKKILPEHVKSALSRSEFSVKDADKLESDEKEILKLINENSGKKIGELYKIYADSGGKHVYKFFQRKVGKLQKNKFITTEKIEGGKGGNTTIIKKKQIKLTEF